MGAMTVIWRSLRIIGLALGLGILLLLTLASPALASIHTYHEQPGQTTYRSRQSLRDQTDLAWQATVFKRSLGDKPSGIYLRLVGFPGQVVVNRQDDLSIQTGTTAHWVAPYRIDLQTEADLQTRDLPENVTQYDFKAVLDQLQRAIPLTLEVSLTGRAPAQIVVAPYVVEEWLQLYRMEND
jgi:hypothetical protein